MKTSIEHVNKESFQREVLDSKGLVVVGFYADWCAPCRSIASSLDELAERYAGQVEIKKVNIDENADLTRSLWVASIPTLIFFRNGKEVKRIVGARPKEGIEAELRSFLNLN